VQPALADTVPADGDERLIRQRAGSYRTADGRFSLENDGGSWFLLDTQQTDELGQPLIQGPYASLALGRAAIETARSAPPSPRPLRKVGGSPTKGARPQRRPPPPPRETWLDRLPADERARARRMIAALERQGVTDAEALVRADRAGFQPAVARRLIERLLAAELPDDAAPAVADAIAATLAILTGRGLPQDRDLPGWALVEVPPNEDPPGRRIILGD
jgi:hypothetical protein